MNDKLIKQLQEINLNEEDLFPQATPIDIKARKLEQLRQFEQEVRVIEEKIGIREIKIVPEEQRIEIPCWKVVDKHATIVAFFRTKEGARNWVDRGREHRFGYGVKPTYYSLFRDEPAYKRMLSDGLTDWLAESRVNEEDLFPNLTSEEVEARKKELKDKEARQAEERSRLYSKFKKGDEVEVVGEGVHDNPEIGAIGKIVGIDSIQRTHPIKVRFDEGNYIYIVNFYDVNAVAKIEKK